MRQAEERQGKQVNQKELAMIYGVTVQAVAKWNAEGCPRIAQGKGRETFYDTAAVHRWLIDRALGRSKAKSVASETADAYLRERQVKTELLEIELAEKRDQLVAIDDIMPIIEAEFTRCRQRLLSIPARAAPQLTHLSSTSEIHAALMKLISEALAELSAEEKVRKRKKY